MHAHPAQPRALALRWRGAQPDPLPAEARVRAPEVAGVLHAFTDYWLDAPEAASLRVGTLTLAPELPGLFRLRPGNHLGLLPLSLLDAQGREGPRALYEALSPRFASLAAQHRFVDALLAELERRLPEALFAQDSPAVSPARHAPHGSPPPDTLVRAFFARHAGALSGALAELASHAPPLHWERAVRRVPAATLAHLDGAALTALMQGPPTLSPTRRRALPPLASSLRTATRVPSPDPRELALAAHCARTLSRALTRSRAPQPALVRALTALLARHPAPASPPARFAPRHGPVRTLHALTARLTRPLAPWLGALSDAIALRDVAYLYERWAALALAERLARTLECDARWAPDARGFSAVLGAHGTLRWQPALRSYTGPLRPDLAWEVDGAARVLFDAKFRAHDERGALREDLDKMHAYRDALGVGSALVLHPGPTTAFFPRRRGLAWPEARAHVDLRALLEGQWQGVGALSLVPEGAQ